VTAVPSADVTIASRAVSARVPVSGLGPRRGPWTGVWRWRATWPGGSFTGEGMTIAQDGQTACATWAWSNGGRAKGSAAGDGTWAADWDDGFGSGTWILALEASGDRFTGTQVVDPDGAGLAFVATIAGERTGGAGGVSLRCSTVAVGRSSPLRAASR
jgi:hypothetical protein